MIIRRLPNLFIIGAPKCGTTALSHYLAQHPQIFMSGSVGIKEPNFFDSDLVLSHIPVRIREWEAYLDLFKAAPAHVKYLGEASPLYLFSKHAIPAILSNCPDARMIVMVRNPLELAASLHNQHAKHWLDVLNFARAWELQGARQRGDFLPPEFTDGTLLQYGEIAKVGIQVERLFELVARQWIHLIVYDDFAANPAKCYETLLKWLDVPNNRRIEFSHMNPSQNYRWQQLEHGLRQLKTIRTYLKIPGGLGLHATINLLNRKKRRKPLPSRLRHELCDYFREDVALLSNLLQRDFSKWLS